MPDPVVLRRAQVGPVQEDAVAPASVDGLPAEEVVHVGDAQGPPHHEGPPEGGDAPDSACAHRVQPEGEGGRLLEGTCAECFVTLVDRLEAEVILLHKWDY